MFCSHYLKSTVDRFQDLKSESFSVCSFSSKFKEKIYNCATSFVPHKTIGEFMPILLFP
jgi:hypothetical protein